MRLGQPWRGEGPEVGFQSGWARVSWSAMQLCWEAVFLTGRASNRARRLNERTWELGDVCEVFVQEEGADHYFELHVTPENQRLQLRFDPHGIERLRSGIDPLDSFLLPQADWVESSTHQGPGYWSTRVLLPAARFGSQPSDCFPGVHRHGLPLRLRASRRTHPLHHGALVRAVLPSAPGVEHDHLDSASGFEVTAAPRSRAPGAPARFSGSKPHCRPRKSARTGRSDPAPGHSG
jgi:hypothetical protein